MKVNQDVYDLGRLRLSMAGSGNPWAVITQLRKGLLYALHDGLSLTDIGTTFKMSPDEVKKELNPLVAANLIMKREKKYIPTFFIANDSETRRVTNHAKAIGHALAERLLTLWPSQIETTYSKLTMSNKYSLCDLGFMLVGAHILDIGLLDALINEGVLMKPAPSRPSPNKPKARYYFWMIEGDWHDLGRYGLDDTDLPWPNWSFLSFGQSLINSSWNADREALDKTCSSLVSSSSVHSPDSLAKRLKIPLFTRTDTSYWSRLVEECTKELVEVYLEYEENLRQLFLTLHASTYAPSNFSEFFCWYDHVSYAWAIDALEAKGLISVPTKCFTAALWYYNKKSLGVLAD